ncbi:hypothetical protein HA402_005282 [Bradysia odoriphaga]|nr:hypothetical protein HA402_005282 [Bradysia odoriphaga]
MDVITAIKLYVNKMTNESGPGMKIMLMDKETTSIISMAFSQSDMMQKEVYLFERLDTAHSNERLKHLKAIVFIRPTKNNIALLCNELRSPRYGSYYIYFSNILPRTDVKLLAESDQTESVRELKEIYADYLCVNPNLFSLNIPNCLHGMKWDQECLSRSVQGVTALLLSLKLKPAIRYRNGSEPAIQLAKQIHEKISKESSLFDFRTQDNGAPPPLLLILDRKDDPVTPLLNQWTYQAMVHELLTINNNRVDLSKVEGAPKDLKEVVLSLEQDEFYSNNIYSNFGEIGQTIKSLMDEFQIRAKSQKKVESIADMRNFVETYPQFKKMSGTITKHVVVIGELSVQVGKKQLLEVSELEQEIACRADHSAQLQRVKKLVADENIAIHDALRLILLYSLRYERHANCDSVGLLNLLKKRGGPVHVVPRMLEYAGQHSRQGDLFNNVKIMDAVKLTRSLIKGLKGVENVFTQHTCWLKEILDDVFKGRTIDPLYPCFGSEPFRRPPQEVIVFIIGGATYEEALSVHSLNVAGYNCILGGTTIHNSDSFIREVLAATEGVPIKHSRSLLKFHNPEGI